MLQTDAWLDEKPYKEIYDGRLHVKVSPQRMHALVQGAVTALLLDWGRDRGDAGPEWRVYLDEVTTLVPDVSFISDRRLASLSKSEREKPPFAPELVVEVRSPEDRDRNIRRKTALYLRHGALAVLNVDPQKRTVDVATANDETTLKPGDVFTDPSFPGLALPVNAIFAPLDRSPEL